MKKPAHLCVRVYASGEARETIRDSAGMKSWLEYNGRYRPGCALFINGVAMRHGYLRLGECRKVETILAKEYRHRRKSLVPEVEGPQVDADGTRRHGYREEPAREPLKLR